MEKEGFIRGLKLLEEYDLSIGLLVTDRHLQLCKYIRENMPDTDHRYDVWHVAKSMIFLSSFSVHANYTGLFCQVLGKKLRSWLKGKDFS